jgi:hypothetical protein
MNGRPRSVREYAIRLWTIAAAAMLAPAVVFVLGPHTIFTTNPGEFAVAFGDLATPWLLRTAALNWLMLVGAGALIALLPERYPRMYAALLLAAGLLLWGQGNLWNADYGLLTGDDIDFAVHAWRAPYELAAWAAVAVAAVWFSGPLNRIAPFATLAFLIVQLSAAAVMTANPTAASRGRWVDPPSELYQFSSTQNVIHIVLDAFQSDVFADMMRQDRAKFDRQFSGFEYFVDHAGVFPTTSFSMVAMLTGEEYRNQKLAPQFVREAFTRSSIFEKLSRQGYEIDAMSIVPTPSMDEWLGPQGSPNWKGARFQIRRPFVSLEDYREVSARQLLELALFRHVPHPVKASMTERPDLFYRAVWMDRDQSIAEVRRLQASNSAAFFEHFIESITVGRSQPVYKLLHVGIPHRPVVVDRECRFIGATRVTRSTFARQAGCAVKLVATFLDRLRALGVYDQSVIVIASDHGTGLRPAGFNGRSDSLPPAGGPSTSGLNTITGTAKALMLIKPRNRSGPITISEAPTSHIDLPSTILDLLGSADPAAEGSMFRRDPTQQRSRPFGMYDLRQRFPKEYLTRLDVLSIGRRVVDGAGWQMQRAIWRPGEKLPARDVDVGVRSASANAHLGPGWLHGQTESVEADGDITFSRAATRQAVLFATLPTGTGEVILRAMSPAEDGPRAIDVDIDGRSTARLDVPRQAAYQNISIKVPTDSQRPPISQITLTFHTDKATQFIFKLDRLSVR